MIPIDPNARTVQRGKGAKGKEKKPIERAGALLLQQQLVQRRQLHYTHRVYVKGASKFISGRMWRGARRRMAQSWLGTWVLELGDYKLETPERTSGEL